MLSGDCPSKVAIYDIETGKEVKELETESVKNDWVRYFACNLTRKHIAIIERHNALLWEPFEDKTETIFELRTEETMLTRSNGMSDVKWNKDGKMLLVIDNDHTLFM